MAKFLNRETSSIAVVAVSGGAFLLAGCDTLRSSKSAESAPVSETARSNPASSAPRAQKAGDIKMKLLCPVGAADIAFNGDSFASSQLEEIKLDLSEPKKMDNGVTVNRSNVEIASQSNEYRPRLTYQSPNIIAFSFSGNAANQIGRNDIVQINYVMNLETVSFKRTASLFKAAASSSSAGSCRIAG